ncbi:MAG: ABC transporter substrate-binding protein [Bacteroides sp.]|nr:ABC transporter substrate-binding protein [Bacteroides sp.]
MKLNTIFLAITIGLLSAFTACKGNTNHKYSSSMTFGQEDTLKYARNLRLEKIDGDGGTAYLATIRNPWDTVKNLRKYLLVPKGMKNVADVPGATKINIPIENALVYSSIHAGLLSDLEADDKIGGVCNARYITDKKLQDRIMNGDVVDCGEGLNPDVEQIINLHPDLVMLSPFENNDRYAKVSQLGIPILECADYMEMFPLGQAEWMKFYGLLFGKADVAANNFQEIESRYEEIRKQAAKRTLRPRVIMDQPYNNSWSVPGGYSTMGRIIEDAGGVNPFAQIKSAGGVALAPERVLAEADDADIWLVRYNQKGEKTLQELSLDGMVNSQFKAFKTGNVYGCNTYYIPFFDETPFHPERLIEELSMIFEAYASSSEPSHLRYFKKMSK